MPIARAGKAGAGRRAREWMLPAAEVLALTIAAGCMGGGVSPGEESEAGEASAPGAEPLGRRGDEPSPRGEDEPTRPLDGASNAPGAGSGRGCTVSPAANGVQVVSTQEQLDELTGCEEVSGRLWIDAPDGVQLDFSPLNSLRRVTGALTIGCNPYLGTDSYCGESVERSLTLEGLENLESVASLTIGGLRVASLAPLRGLRRIDNDLDIVNCNALQSLDGLEGASVGTLSLQHNARLSSLSGLAITPDAQRIHIEGAPALVDLSALAPLTSVNHLELREMPLQNLDVLSNLALVGSIYLMGVPQLNDISGLARIREVERLYLERTALENLDALQLESVEDLELWDNPVLAHIDALGGISHSGEIDIVGNDSLVSLPTFPNVTQITSVFLQDNAALIEGPRFPNLERMPSGTIAIADNPSLARIDGFSRLREVARIEIRQNAQLLAIDFGQLTSAGTLHVTCNPELPAAALAPLMQVSSPDRLLDGNLGSASACQPL